MFLFLLLVVTYKYHHCFYFFYAPNEKEKFMSKKLFTIYKTKHEKRTPYRIKNSRNIHEFPYFHPSFLLKRAGL